MSVGQTISIVVSVIIASIIVMFTINENTPREIKSTSNESSNKIDKEENIYSLRQIIESLK